MRWYPVVFASSAALALTAALAAPLSRPALAHDEATAKLFKAKCVSCHGEDGRGQTTAGRKAGVRDWTDGKTLKALSDPDIAKLIREGKKDKDGKQRMPPNKGFQPAQIEALIKHVRSLQHAH